MGFRVAGEGPRRMLVQIAARNTKTPSESPFHFHLCHEKLMTKRLKVQYLIYRVAVWELKLNYYDMETVSSVI